MAYIRFGKIRPSKITTAKPFSPLSLFQSGESGSWYDPSDLTVDRASWRKNVLAYTERFDNGSWLKVTSSVAIGGEIALITPSSGNIVLNAGPLMQSISTLPTSLTIAADFQSAGLRYAAVGMSNGAGFTATATFDLQTGVVANTGYHPSVATSASANITSIGLNWYRCSFTIINPSSMNYVIFGGSTTTNDPLYNRTITGDGINGVRVRYPQCQAGTSATPYQKIISSDGISTFLSLYPTHTLYQDSWGTTPVTTLGQPVGLVLDKKSGGLNNLGPNLISNGTFDTGITGWNGWGGSTISWDSVNKRAITTFSSSGEFGISPTIPPSGGRGMLVTFDVTNLSATNKQYNVVVYATPTIAPQTPFSVLPGETRTVSFVMLFPTGSGTMAFRVSGGGFSVGEQHAFSNISVREIPGTHLWQPTNASRPTLEARTNILTYSEQFDNGVWATQNGAVTANASIAPDGTLTADRFTITSSSQYTTVRRTVSVYPATTYTYSYWLNTTTAPTGAGFRVFDITNLQSIVDGLPLNYSGGWVRQSYTFTTPISCSSVYIYLASYNAGPTDAGKYFDLWGAQMEIGSGSTTYQRVVTATDYADVGAPRYLQFDGVDDSLYTAANLNLSGTDKLTLFTGIQKNSDVSASVVAELSTTTNTSGSFGLWGPNTDNTNDYGWFGTGTIARGNIFSGYSAGTKHVLIGQLDIAGSSLSARVNGLLVASSSLSLGTGNLSSNILYVGRRNNTSRQYNGRIYQLLVRGASTDSSTLSLAERWIAQKSGITI